jgi:hypothetical protein
VVFATLEGEVVVSIALQLLTLLVGFRLVRSAASCMNTIHAVFNHLPKTFPAKQKGAKVNA